MPPTMTDGLTHLIDIGFKVAGMWNVDGKAIAFDLNEFGNARNVLYAFTADGELMYVGKTVQPLRSRMIG